MSWGVGCTGRGALHSWMVKTPWLMIIIIIPALAAPSSQPAGPTSLLRKVKVGQGGRFHCQGTPCDPTLFSGGTS